MNSSQNRQPNRRKTPLNEEERNGRRPPLSYEERQRRRAAMHRKRRNAKYASFAVLAGLLLIIVFAAGKILNKGSSTPSAGSDHSSSAPPITSISQSSSSGQSALSGESDASSSASENSAPDSSSVSSSSASESASSDSSSVSSGSAAASGSFNYEDGIAQPNADTNGFVQDAEKCHKRDCAPAQNHNAAARRYAYRTEDIRRAMFGDPPKHFPEGKIAFLTYDDGLSPDSTPRLLDALAKEGVPATFFVVGNTLSESTKPYLQRIYQEGHALALHSYTHVYDQLYPGGKANPDEVVDQFRKSQDAVSSLLGQDLSIRCWRYPGGHMSWDNIEAADSALAEQGVAWIDWNSINGDANAPSAQPKDPAGQVASVLDGWNAYGCPDVIVILMHDRPEKAVTRDSVPQIVAKLRELGFSFGVME